MKKFIRWAMCLGLCLGLLVCGALAAESGINVQLDGQNLTFTDAAPQVKDQRTFLPFRAVFEAMGAEVDNEGNTITAVRGDKTLTMTIGSTEATVTENGVAVPITMDVAPYVDTSIWRTYVPVRFAAQAFDCAVGWDQGAKTAIIVDTEKLVKEVMKDKSFTYLEKIAAMGDKYKEGIWNMDATMDLDVNMLTSSLMTMDGAISGSMQDNAKMDMTMNMKMDMDGMLTIANSMGGAQMTDEDLAMLNTLKTDGVDVAVRGDINTGKIYMNMDLSAFGAAAAEAGLDSNAWYELDMAALMEQAGMSWSDLMAMSESVDMTDALISSLSATQPNDAANGYAELKKSFDLLFTAFADQSFQDVGGGTYVAEYTLQENGANMNVILNLVLEGDQVTTYSMNLTADAGASGSFDISTLMTADGKMTVGIRMGMGEFITMTMVMDGNYTPGTAAPVVTPPAGAKIVPFTDLAGQTGDLGDLGIIGGADGPTSIIVSDPA